ncbi:NAD(P)/FAD-dependent oxidoreductase [Aureibacillus halotolerans]|uniref:Ferredoxin--NADP reductase n=1 Tax=Aureibacillus halotolerans TaxID=1508390 RepID=A0A4R6U4K2_9BACI|nr:NAD(P)/FAD-dependent oxidoreductase [Aureibacillus halotolerans]TDQ41081.1 thioredoxin reductase (NADPH) [Aureibacillus halotolerans]
MSQPELYDVTIIGGGPAGLYSAFYCGMRDMKTKIIEHNDRLGGKVLLYQEKMIWDIGGMTPLNGEQLVENLIQQANTFDPTFVFKQRIQYMERLENGHIRLTAETGEVHESKTVIIAAGSGVLVQRKLEIEGAEKYEVSNLHYTVTSLEQFKGKRVLISGGGDSAVDWANEIAPIAESVTIVHRRDMFGGLERHVRHMKEVAEVLTPYALTTLHSTDGSMINSVTISNVDTEEEETLFVDEVIVNHGVHGDHGLLREWGLDMTQYQIYCNKFMETELPGVFCAGDTALHEGKLRLIAGAFVEAGLAANAAKTFIDPEATKAAYVSSHNERFKEKNKELQQQQRVGV